MVKKASNNLASEFPSAFKSRPKKSSTAVPKTIKVSNLSEASQDVLQYFGIECPTLLNEYAIALEDALIESISKQELLKIELEKLKDMLNDSNGI